MKFLHISDLHLGRQLHRFPLQEEQIEILEHIRRIVGNEKPDAVLIAGDVYDRSIPPVYATQMLDDFLAGLLKTGTTVCMISGNHDSAERLGFLSRPLASSGLHISPAYHGTVSRVTLQDAAGPVDVWLMPYIRPAAVRPFFPDVKIENTNDAVACVLSSMDVNHDHRNILVAHQFVAGAALIGSEDACSLMNPQDLTVGGSDLVEARLFSDFDYVALGHLHHAQNFSSGGHGLIRYSGTPLKYSFSELRSEKSVTIADLSADRTVTLRTIPLPEPRRLQEIRGLFSDITSDASVAGTDRDAYTHVILTDDHPIPDVITRLRQVYPNLTHLEWDNSRTRLSTDSLSAGSSMRQHTPYDLFSEFFEQVNGCAMTQEQAEFMSGLIRGIWEEEV